MGDSLLRNRDYSDAESTASTANPVSTSPRDQWLQASLQTSGPGFQYEELMGGSIPCPSCMGSGRIPKEREGELVALIPVNDKRLRPRRTCLYVSLGIGLSAIVCGLLLFFLIPRSISIDSSPAPVLEVKILRHVEGELIVLNFVSSVNVNNGNFYPVQVKNASASVINKWNVARGSVVIGHGSNNTGLSIPMRKEDFSLALNYTAEIRDRWMVDFCESQFGYYVNMEFDVTVTFEYMGHTEQDTSSMTHSVCCQIHTGNCTLSAEEEFDSRGFLNSLPSHSDSFPSISS